MKKQLSNGVVGVTLTVVALIVGFLAWKFVLAPPQPVGSISRTKEEIAEAFKLNGETIAHNQAEQIRRYNELHPGAAATTPQASGGTTRSPHLSKKDAGQGK